MSENSATPSEAELNNWDLTFVKQVKEKFWPILRRYFRAEVHGLENLPAHGGILIVANHSGGSLTPDVVIFGPAFYDRFGYGRKLFTLAHSQVFFGPFEGWLGRLGVIHATRDNAAAALRSGAAVLAFPGGDYDAYRPTLSANTIDFDNRKGYVTTALAAGVPIVPMVSIGGQETQLFLTRGTGLARRLGLGRLRVRILPVSIGFPFGLSVFVPPNVPLPAKIVTQVLRPIDIERQFGKHPDVDAVDEHIRSVMQEALDELGRRRRFPLLG